MEETASGAIRVHLDRARTPRPRWLPWGGWRPVIRSYAKYVDVVARSLAVVQDEQENVRRERMDIEEIDELLRGDG